MPVFSSVTASFREISPAKYGKNSLYPSPHGNQTPSSLCPKVLSLLPADRFHHQVYTLFNAFIQLLTFHSQNDDCPPHKEILSVSAPHYGQKISALSCGDIPKHVSHASHCLHGSLRRIPGQFPRVSEKGLRAVCFRLFVACLAETVVSVCFCKSIVVEQCVDIKAGASYHNGNFSFCPDFFHITLAFCGRSSHYILIGIKFIMR